MNILLTFIWIIAGFIAMSFWEAYIEGKHPWAGLQIGWKKKLTKKYCLTAYHFWIYVMFFFFLTLPLIVAGWSLKLFGVLISASSIGFVLEDFFWFVVNPVFQFKNFNSKKVNWYPWLKIWKFEIPWGYLIGIIIAVLSWYFLWK